MTDGHRARRRAELAALLERADARETIRDGGTPVLLLDLETVRRQYRRLTRALPGVRFHYAVKALAHPAVIGALRDEDAWFDVASLDELATVTGSGVEPGRVICTQPIKTMAELHAMYASGVRTVVVDNPTEVAKLAGSPPDLRALVRLAYPNPTAGCDLSSKFGVDPGGAGKLVEQALGQGTTVAGFSFHVGSQLDDVRPFREAVARTLDLMGVLEARLSVRFDTLDIGGGIPAGYDRDVIQIEDVAAALRPLLAGRSAELDVIAEPGRVVVADAMTLVTSVVGLTDRPDGRWYYLDDGLYGSYSNVLTEHVQPLVIAEREARGIRPSSRATLAGPTCDSSDVICRAAPMPELEIGDLVLSPTMGAYTAVTASRFNGRPLTRIVPLRPRRCGDSGDCAP